MLARTSTAMMDSAFPRVETVKGSGLNNHNHEAMTALRSERPCAPAILYNKHPASTSKITNITFPKHLCNTMFGVRRIANSGV